MSTIIHWNSVKIRKPHRCFGCGKEYQSGSAMTNAAYTNNGTIHTAYWCPVCAEYMNRYFQFGEECSYRDIYDNDRQGWESLKSEMESKNELK